MKIHNQTTSRMQKKLFKLLLFIGMLSPLGAIAQLPVQVNGNLFPPYSVKLSDYATADSDRMVFHLLLRDVNEFNRQVVLKLFIQGNNGFSARSTDVVLGATPITLNGGVPTRLTNIDLRPYFQLENLAGIAPQQYSQPLAAGLYQFCFEVYDYLSGQQLGEKGCATAYIVLNDPPILNMPVRGENVMFKDPQNIVFQWTPRHINATNVQYEFTLVEIWDNNIDPQAAFLAGTPLYQTTTRANMTLYGPGETPLLPDKTYGWRVRAIVTDGISELSLFKNKGYSEIYHFYYTKQCTAPQYVLAESNSNSSAMVYWQGYDHSQYKVQYRKKNGDNAKWYEVNAYNEQARIQRLQENTTYEYRVGGKCGENGAYTFSRIFEFTTTTRGGSDFTCGVTPQINIDNREPLQTLVVNDIFTAGEFPVTVKRVLSGNTESPAVGELAQGGTGVFSGWGYITVPYLSDTRIKIGFVDIKINNDYELIDGILVSDYDPNWGGMVDIGDTVDTVGDVIDTVGDTVGDAIDTVGDVIGGIGSGEDTPVVDPDTTPVDPDNPNPDPTITDPPIPVEDPPAEEEPVVVTDPPVDPDTNDPETEETENSIFIRYNGKDYKNGDKIEIQYERDLPLQRFELIGIKGEKITWDVYKNFNDIAVIKAFTDTDNDVSFNVLAMPNRYVLAAEYEEKKDIRVNIHIIKDEFSLTELTATHKKEPKRIAKSGKTLYLIDNKGVLQTKKEVIYNAIIEPNLNSNEYAKIDFKWYYDKAGTSGNDPKDIGEKDIVRNLIETNRKIETRAEVGYPVKTTKSVDVKWEEQYETSTDYLSKFNKVLTFLEQFNRVNEKFKKVLPCEGSILKNFEALVGAKKIAFKLKTYNEEDKESREIYDILQTNLKLQYADLAKIECGKDIGYLGVAIGKLYGGMALGSTIDFKYSLKTKNETQEQKTVPQISGGLVLTTDFGFKTNDILDEYFYAKLALEIKAGTKTIYPYKGENHLIGSYFYLGKTNFVVEGYIDTWLTGRENFNFKFLVFDTYLESDLRLVFDLKAKDIYLE